MAGIQQHNPSKSGSGTAPGVKKPTSEGPVTLPDGPGSAPGPSPNLPGASQDRPWRSRGAPGDPPNGPQTGPKPLRATPKAPGACPGPNFAYILAVFCMKNCRKLACRAHLQSEPSPARRPVRSTLNPPRARRAWACRTKWPKAYDFSRVFT